MIRVEVVYALPEEQYLVVLELEPSATARQAVTRSGILDRFPELKRQALSFGIFSRPVQPDSVLSDGDRVEIYRPLQVDPKQARRLRAAAKKKKTD